MIQNTQLATYKSEQYYKLRNIPIERLFEICLLFLALALISCSKPTPTEPSVNINIDQEAALIPWQKIIGKIAYSRTTTDGSLEGYLFIIDGNSKKLSLVKTSTGVQFANLAWSSDGTKLTYSNFDIKTECWQLYNINIDGSNQSPVYSVDAHNNYPSWSHDGRLAYWFNGVVDQVYHGYEIWIGSAPFFQKSRCDLSRTAWSPDDKFLVISLQDQTSQGALYKVSIADTTIKPLLQGSGGYNQEIFHSPIYSPDGKKIAFMKFGITTQGEIWIMDADRTNLTRLTTGQSDDFPAWSPDGNQIAFMRFASGSGARIFLMNADGSQQTQITRNEGGYPTWIP